MTVCLYIMLCALISPEPEERTDLGAKSPERVFTNFIRVSCESASEAEARGVGMSAIAQSEMKTFLNFMRVRIVGLANENAHAY